MQKRDDPFENLSTMQWPDAKSVDRVPSKGERIEVKVISVHDGDTFCALVPIGNAFLKLDVRVLGIDAPEVQVRDATKGTELGRLQEQAGAVVRNCIAALIDQQVIGIRCTKWDKYGGRVLADVWLPDGQLLSEYLLQRQFVKAYQGQKKQAWTQEELDRIIAQ
jgi:endonuclease YncB( thermonuclease family)